MSKKTIAAAYLVQCKHPFLAQEMPRNNSLNRFQSTLTCKINLSKKIFNKIYLWSSINFQKLTLWSLLTCDTLGRVSIRSYFVLSLLRIINASVKERERERFSHPRAKMMENFEEKIPQAFSTIIWIQLCCTRNAVK